MSQDAWLWETVETYFLIKGFTAVDKKCGISK